MRKTALILSALALSFTAATFATGQQTKQTTGPQEQPGPFGFPGVKHMTEVLMLSGEQAAALHRIYSDYQKKEQKAQQEANKEAQANKNSGGKAPRADTKGLRDDMVNEIKAILTEDQRKKFDELLSDMGKKKKKAA
jgi:Spy/CpxP family protein refolding chaperone